MIKKLRFAFILIAMLSVIFVLTVIIGSINISNYVRINSESDAVLDMLIDNNGRFPNMSAPSKPGQMGGFSAETPYETRYFSVVISNDGEAVYADVGQIAAISSQDAVEIAKGLYDKDKTSGMYGDYKYKTVSADTGVLYVFLDCSRNLSTFRSFLYMSLIISALGVVVVFLLVIVFSRIVFKPVEESYAKQKMFITNASHDIKTPLTVINTDAEVIEMTNGESEWTDDIKKQIVRLTSLTDKLVFLSRMEEANLKLDFVQFNISEVIEEMCQPYCAVAEKRGIELKTDIEKDVTISGNEQALGQAIALLMDNAVKYACDDGVISVTLKKRGKGCVLYFKNDADGVEKGDNSNLFERFYRGDKSRNSATGGNGIGLSVVKAIIDAHNGKITANSADGKSIEFVITL
jgi:signal transduction histidine kinase